MSYRIAVSSPAWILVASSGFKTPPSRNRRRISVPCGRALRDSIRGREASAARDSPAAKASRAAQTAKHLRLPIRRLYGGEGRNRVPRAGGYVLSTERRRAAGAADS